MKASRWIARFDSASTTLQALARFERWRAILGQARRHGSFMGVDERVFPRDFATFVRYHKELRAIPTRYPLPEPLSLTQLEAFVQHTDNRYAVTWESPL